MRDAMDWVRGHIAIVVGAVAVVVVVAAVAIMVALGVFSSKAEMPKIMSSEEATVDVSLSVTADAGWTVDSTPAIVHVKGADEDTSEVDFYHAVAADEEGNKGSSKVTITEGSYTVAFLAPVNADGSTFNIDAAVATQSIEVDADADAPTVACAMAQIPADQVGDDVLQAAIANLRAAVDLGDATLKGNAGRDILAKMEANIANNPNVSEETKVEAERVEEEADVDSTPVSTVVTRPYTPSQGGSYTPPSTGTGNQGSGQGGAGDGGQGGGQGDQGGTENPPVDPGQGGDEVVDPNPGGDQGGTEGGGTENPPVDPGQGGGEVVDPNPGGGDQGGTEGGGDQGGTGEPETPPVDPGTGDSETGGNVDVTPETPDTPSVA